MNARIPIQPARTPESFGLIAVIESKRVILPLKGAECDFRVASGVAEVEMTQLFRQENEKPLDCDYLFPLPADAAVYFCEADINGRTIRAEVRERQEARQLAEEKKAEGFRTALVEAERENLFTLSLGNVQPGDLVIIRLKYFQTLRSLAGKPSLEIPFCPGVRYIPGKPLLRSNQGKGIIDDTDEVPDASRITPVRIDALHPDAAYIDVRGALEARFVNEKELSSPSHQVVTQRMGEELRMSLSDKGEVPDRDFVLRWSENNVGAVASRAWTCQRGGESYALLEIRAPQDAPRERAPVDFYFLVDRSGSMAGEKWNKAAEALQSCMKVLGSEDRAMVTFFESGYQDFAERPLRVRDILQDRQFQKIRDLGTAGGTELRPALKHVLEVASHQSAARSKNLILITDAQIGNESAILELMKTAADFPVHCFGIDVALNDSLLLALCRQQGGTFCSLNPNDNIPQAVSSLGQTLGRPVLLDLRLSDGWETADAMIPNLYAGQIHYLSARSSSDSTPILTARDAAGQPFKTQFETQTAASQAAYLHWSRSRIQRLLAEENAREAIALSVESNLICRLTAFIAWDETEKVAVATHSLAQPSMELAEGERRHYGKVLSTQHFIARHSRAAAISKHHRFTVHEQLFERSAAPEDESVPDELNVRLELSKICHQAGVSDWETMLKVLWDWIASASGAERARRLEAARRLLTDIKVQARQIEQMRGAPSPEQAEEARQRIRQLLKEFVDKLPVH